MLRRTPLKRSPMRRKRTYTGPTRSVAQIVFARSGGVCEFPGCRAGATDKHHRLNRKAGGRKGARAEQINQAAWLMAACRHHHQWVTDNPFEAYQMGWLLHENEDAEDTHVQTSDGPVLLDNRGGRRPV
jgi:hypothetical protein